MHLFYCPDLAPALIELPEEEAHHAVNVLRLSVGNAIGLLDGKGTFAEAEVAEATRKKCIARILRKETEAAERRAKIHLAVAPTKQMERFEWFLEKATEIGVDRITPVLTHRTERDKLRRDRMEKVLVGAMKQSQRKWLPQLDELTKLKEMLSPQGPLSIRDRAWRDPAATAATADSPQKFFGWCEGEHVDLTSAYDTKKDALMLIGPEGDFTPEEAEILLSNGFQAVSLGKARLRTETAAIAACTWMSFAQQ